MAEAPTNDSEIATLISLISKEALNLTGDPVGAATLLLMASASMHAFVASNLGDEMVDMIALTAEDTFRRTLEMVRGKSQ